MSYKEDILKLRDEGKSYREIEKILGCSRGTISYYLGNKEEVKMETTKPVTAIQEKAKTYSENIRLKKACQQCSQYLHFSALEYISIPDLEGTIAKIETPEDFVEFKKQISNSYVLCSNCNKLRLYKEANNSKRKVD
jgi:hypothetical protein